MYFLIGADKLDILSRWHNHKDFFRDFCFAVVKRDGSDPERQIAKNKVLSSYQDRFYIVPEPAGISQVSSTIVRDLLIKKDPDVQNLLHPGVLQFLLTRGITPPDIISFQGSYAFLSNFYEADIWHKGILYKNSEAAFQTQKCLDDAVKKFSLISVAKAKKKGQTVSLRKDWEAVKLDVMGDVVREKFLQNPELAARLLSTKNRELIEGNTWNDTFWGVNLDTGKGENHLGQILTNV